MKTSLSSLPTETTHNNSVFKKVLIRANEQNGQVGTFNYAWLDKGMKLDTHSHADSEEYYLFLSGNGKMMIGDEWFAVAKDDFVTIPPHHDHTAENTEDEPLIFISLRVVLSVEK